MNYLTWPWQMFVRTSTHGLGGFSILLWWGERQEEYKDPPPSQAKRQIWVTHSLIFSWSCTSFKAATMSLSPERMSSYRRHFEGAGARPGNQLRRSSPSPSRKETRHRSSSFHRHGERKAMGCRVLTSQPRLTRWVSTSDPEGAIIYSAHWQH